VSGNRLQNVVITLDKVKLCMEQEQCREPPQPNPKLCCGAGVSDNRLQNVVITLDKVKLCMEQGQCREPPLRLLADAEVAEHLWTGARARARRRTRPPRPRPAGDGVRPVRTLRCLA